MKTLYTILGVESTATLETIRKAYYKIQRENHPDKTGQLPYLERLRREEVCKASIQAWEILSDEKAKEEYDQRIAWTHEAPKPAGCYPARPPPPRPTKPAPAKPEMPTNFTPYAFHENAFQPEPLYDPDNLVWNNNGWSFEMRTSPRCRNAQPWEADGNRVSAHEGGIVIFTRLGNVPTFPGQNDVTLSITATPNSRKISEVRSFFQKTNFYGTVETVLWVSISTSNISHADALPKWDFAWNVIPAGITMHIPETAPNWAVYLVFHTKAPAKEMIHWPSAYLEQFDELQPMVHVELTPKTVYKQMSHGLGANFHHVHRLAAAVYTAVAHE